MVTDERDADGSLTRSERLDLLSSKRRRVLLELLVTSDTDIHSLESLATAITQTEQQSDLGARPARRVCLFLHHVHLPKLEDAGIVEYDAARKRVEYLGGRQTEQLLERVQE